jgi:hypothetical protein
VDKGVVEPDHQFPIPTSFPHLLKLQTHEAKMWATPKTSSPSWIWGPRETAVAVSVLTFLGGYIVSRELT